MNRRQLQKLGVPPQSAKIAIAALGQAAIAQPMGLKGKRAREAVLRVVQAPDRFVEDPIWGKLAASLIAGDRPAEFASITYRTWGDDIDSEAHAQMRQACQVPSAAAAALMPDAHVGYGLPIGGVLGCENAIIPYAVGVDIACRMKLSILDTPVDSLKTRFNRYKESLEKGTRFGVGRTHKPHKSHDVMDRDWSVTRITREKKDTAWGQLGTSGSGNHFVEYGVLSLAERSDELGLEAGQYVGLLSHSGSRGPGAAVCSTYSSIARSRLDRRYQRIGRLAWLDLDSEAGQEYWAAMTLMGEYAAANHDVIHREVTGRLGGTVIAGVENHHNFAWKETHDGRTLIVHRKGATPAGRGVLGVIPGSMADPAYVVRGKGCGASLNSAAHGAGRRMSRKQAKERYRFTAIQKQLADRGISVLTAGSDEVPGVYKNIDEVMAAQQELVDRIARFDPRIVKMAD